MCETKAPKGKNEEPSEDRARNHKPFSTVSAKVKGRILLEEVERGNVIAYNDQQCVSRYRIYTNTFDKSYLRGP